MRLQTLLHGGPYDMEMVVVQSEGGNWPAEIRVGSADLALAHDEDKIEVAAYQIMDEAEETYGVWLGSYRYVGMKQSYPTLVQLWN